MQDNLTRHAVTKSNMYNVCRLFYITSFKQVRDMYNDWSSDVFIGVIRGFDLEPLDISFPYPLVLISLSSRTYNQVSNINECCVDNVSIYPLKLLSRNSSSRLVLKS